MGYLDVRFAVNDTISVLAAVVQLALVLVVATVVLVATAVYGLLRLSLWTAGRIHHRRHER